MSFTDTQDQGSDKIFYRQCRVICEIKEPKYHYLSYKEKVVWIPEKYAFVDKLIRFKENKEWGDIWQVKEVYSRRSEKELLSTERDYMTQRLVSDV